MTEPESALRAALALVLVLAAGCRDGGGGQNEPEPTSGVPEMGATLEATTLDEPAPPTGTTNGDSTSDAGRTTSAGLDTSEATSSSSDGTSSSSEATSTTGDPTTDTGDADTGEPSECTFSESFLALPDGSGWPAPWVALEGVMLADVQAGRGRLLPITGPYALARMYVPLGPSCVDVEGTFTFELTDGLTPGVGLYLRHNGGFLDQTEPPGQGYVAFVQAFGELGTGIGVWRELDGVETILAPFTPAAIAPGIVHAVRFRVTQEDADTTRLRARVWPLEQLEPAGWHVNLTDDTPSLQGVGGGLVIDVWSQLQAGVANDVFVDDIAVGPAP